MRAFTYNVEHDQRQQIMQHALLIGRTKTVCFREFATSWNVFDIFQDEKDDNELLNMCNISIHILDSLRDSIGDIVTVLYYLSRANGHLGS